MAECRDYTSFCDMLANWDETARLILRMQHNFMRSCRIDPLNGAGLSLDLDAFLQRLGDCSAETPSCERLDRILRHCGGSLRKILENPNEILLREHALLPLQSVRELDTVSLSWLNPKPGRNIRQKMSASRSILAPHRRWSMNTSENRLVKKFLRVLLDYMAMRASASDDDSREELESWHNIHARWIHKPEVLEIGPWENTAPNNILLSNAP